MEPEEDPFAPQSDPYPAEHRLTRRALGKLLAAAPLLTGCLHTRTLGCAPATGAEGRCQHRFCRYYSGPR